MEEKISELERINKLYLDTALTLIELFFKISIKEISIDEALEKIKSMVRPDMYNRIYHSVVLKDNLGIVNIPLNSAEYDIKYPNKLNDVEELKILK